MILIRNSECGIRNAEFGIDLEEMFPPNERYLNIADVWFIAVGAHPCVRLRI